jgi:hypothetical protein
VVTFAAPTVPPLPVEYELHISTTTGFTPSTSTLNKRASETTFNVTGLTPGTTYYVKVVPRDAVGNRGAASAEATVSPRYVEPRILQPRITPSAILNADFEALNDSATGPDGWTTTGGTWGTDVASTSTAYAGGQAIQFAAGVGAGLLQLTSQPFTVRAGEQWVFSTWSQQSAAGVRTGSLVVTWLSSLVSTLSATTVAIGTTSTVANTWERAFFAASVPSGARYAVVSVVRSHSLTGTLTVDSVDGLRTVSPGAWTAVTYQNSWSDWNVAIFYAVQYRVDDKGIVQFRGLARSPTPAPAANAAIFTLPVGCRPLSKLLFRVNASSGATEVQIGADGVVIVGSITAAQYLPFDGLSFQAEQ